MCPDWDQLQSNARNLFILLKCKRRTAICLDNNSRQLAYAHELHNSVGIVDPCDIAIGGGVVMKAHSDFMRNHKPVIARTSNHDTSHAFSKQKQILITRRIRTSGAEILHHGRPRSGLTITSLPLAKRSCDLQRAAFLRSRGDGLQGNKFCLINDRQRKYELLLTCSL